MLRINFRLSWIFLVAYLTSIPIAAISEPVNFICFYEGRNGSQIEKVFWVDLVNETSNAITPLALVLVRDDTVGIIGEIPDRCSACKTREMISISRYSLRSSHMSDQAVYSTGQCEIIPMEPKF